MVRHHLVAALAKFARSPLTTAAYVLTLAVGLCAFLTAWGVGTHWRMSDAHFENSDRTYVLTHRMVVPSLGIGPAEWVTTAVEAAPYLERDIPDLEAVARFSAVDREASVQAGDRVALLNGAMVDPAFLRIFDFDFLEGDPRSALATKDGVLLTASAAARLFGDSAALGQTVSLYRDSEDVDAGNTRLVSGVIADVRQPSHMGSGPDALSRFDYLRAWSDEEAQGGRWTIRSAQTYLLARDASPATARALRAGLEAFAERRVRPDVSGDAVHSFGATPLSGLQARRFEIDQFAGLAGRLPATAVLMGLGMLVLAVACFNCSNLLAVRAVEATRALGMRKVLGADRATIIAQIWIEAGLLSAAALAAAILAMWAISPIVAARSGIDLAAAIAGGSASFIVCGVCIVAVTIASATYPALVAVGVRPAAAIAGRGAPFWSRSVMMALVGAQFAASSALLIGVLVLNEQNDVLRAAALSRDGDPVVVLNRQSRSGVDIETLAAALESRPQIVSVGAMHYLPWDSPLADLQFVRPDRPDMGQQNAWVHHVGVGFFKTFEFEVLAGRVYESDRDSVAEAGRGVIDRALAESLGFDSPQDAVGSLIGLAPSIGDYPPIEVIGVVENRPLQISTGDEDGNAYALNDVPGRNYPVVRISADDVPGGVAAIEEIWGELAPHLPLDLRFADALFEARYRAFGRIAFWFAALSAAALATSAAGLAAMASHITQRRTREVGIRKTTGAKVAQIVTLFVRQFATPVVVANVLAWPFVYIALANYLSPFTLRVDLGVRPFLTSLVVTVVLACLVVAGQALRAASVRPADALRQA